MADQKIAKNLRPLGPELRKEDLALAEAILPTTPPAPSAKLRRQITVAVALHGSVVGEVPDLAAFGRFSGLRLEQVGGWVGCCKRASFLLEN